MMLRKLPWCRNRLKSKNLFTGSSFTETAEYYETTHVSCYLRHLMYTNLFVDIFCFNILLLKFFVFRLQTQSKFKICRHEQYHVMIQTLANTNGHSFTAEERELLIFLAPRCLTFHSCEIFLQLFSCCPPAGVGFDISIIQRNGLRTVHFCVCISDVKILVREHSFIKGLS